MFILNYTSDRSKKEYISDFAIVAIQSDGKRIESAIRKTDSCKYINVKSSYNIIGKKSD